jgi:hypothetical protein
VVSEELAFLRKRAEDLSKKKFLLLDLIAGSPEATVAKVELAVFPDLVLEGLRRIENGMKLDHSPNLPGL